MYKFSNLRVLVCNDDGIYAPGIKALEKIIRGITPDVWVIAPESNQTGMARAVTMKRPLRIHNISPRKFAIDGTPADCVIMALDYILKDTPVDLIVSGINEGCNLGDDISLSGTVGAAIQGTFKGIKSIAFSQNFKTPGKWSIAEHFAPMIIRKMITTEWETDTLLNVNFPDVEFCEAKGIKVVKQGRHAPCEAVHSAIDHWGGPCFWLGSDSRGIKFEENTDLWGVDNGYITVTPLKLDMTSYNSLDRISGIFE